MYALVARGGVANVNPVTHAMAANLAGADPSSLESGNSVSAASISELDSSMQSAISQITAATGATGSLLTSSYTSALDATLDNLKITTNPNGKSTIATTKSQASDDMGTGATSSSFSALTLTPGTSSSTLASQSTNLPSDSNSILKATDLKYLATQFTNCFSTPAGTNLNGRISSDGVTPISTCAPSNFTSNTNTTDTAFKNSGYYWMDPTFFGSSAHPAKTNGTCNTGADLTKWTSPYCRGYFGVSLTSATYDNATFLTPQVIRPLNLTAGTWLVRFPILYSDGSRDNLGTETGISWVVVQKTSPVSGNDTGWRLVGDQRDFPASAISQATQTTNTFNKNYTRWNSALNFYIGGGFSETDPNHFIKSAVVHGPALPPGGLTYINDMSAAGANPLSSLNNLGNLTYTAQCGSLTGGAYLALQLNSGNGTPPCSSTYKLITTASDPAYTVNCNLSVSKSTYYYCNNGNTNVSDTSLATIFDGQVGHPYQVTLTLGKVSNPSQTDGTLTYVVRLQNPPLNSTSIQNAAINYASFTSASASAFQAFNGTGNLTMSWSTPYISPRPFKAQLMWSMAGEVLNYGFNKTIIDNGNVTLSCSSAGNTGVPRTNCQSHGNWNNSSTLPTVDGGGGLFSINGRYPSGLVVQTQLSQY